MRPQLSVRQLMSRYLQSPNNITETKAFSFLFFFPFRALRRLTELIECTMDSCQALIDLLIGQKNKYTQAEVLCKCLVQVIHGHDTLSFPVLVLKKKKKKSPCQLVCKS